MKIAIFEVEPWEEDAFVALGRQHEVAFEAERLGPGLAEKHKDAAVISTFIYSDLGCEVLERFDDLRLIATRSTGIDHIDMDFCADNHIKVANVPSYGENTVAEHAFALLLAISHRLVEAVDRTRRGDFTIEGLEGFDLEGRTMGIIGTGNIGLNAARIAKGFGMEVLGFDVAPRQEAAARIGFAYVGVDELLARSDVISLHVPGNDKTRNLIADAEFDKMRDGVVLINTSRGTVVETRALLKALAGGKLRAAGLDVIPEEPIVREEAELLRSFFEREQRLDTLLADHILLRMRNVVITPHTAFFTREAVQRILDVSHDNIASFVAGKPENIVSG